MAQGNSRAAKQREKAHEEWNRNPGMRNSSRQPNRSHAEPAERKPLEWREIHTQRRGKAVAVVSAATNVKNETIYSVRFSRLGKDDKPGGYFQINDLHDLEALISDVDVYVESLVSGNGEGNGEGNGAGNGEAAQDQPN
jgi:hypothetical protein